MVEQRQRRRRQAVGALAVLGLAAALAGLLALARTVANAELAPSVSSSGRRSLRTHRAAAKAAGAAARAAALAAKNAARADAFRSSRAARDEAKARQFRRARELWAVRRAREAKGLPPLFGKDHTLDVAMAAWTDVEPLPVPPPENNDGRALVAGETEGGPSRVAHCLVGQRRTMDHPLIVQNYEAHVLSKVGAPSDVFLVLDAPTDAAAAFEPVATSYLEVQSTYYQYGRWLQCLTMIRRHERTSGARYSHVILSRVDQMVLMDLPSIDAFPETSIWVPPHGEFMAHYSFEYSIKDEGAEVPGAAGTFQPDLGIPDAFQIVPRPLFDDYMAAIREVYLSPEGPREKRCAPAGAAEGSAEGEAVTTAQLCAHGDEADGPECVLKCALVKSKLPVVRQNFQLRVLRPHGKGGCGWFGAGARLRAGTRRAAAAPRPTPREARRHYSSLCI